MKKPNKVDYGWVEDPSLEEGGYFVREQLASQYRNDLCDWVIEGAKHIVIPDDFPKD